MKKIYFLGGGNMASAIISGLINIADFEIIVVERNATSRTSLQQRYQIKVFEQMPELTADDVLILAIKPQDIQLASSELAVNGCLTISIAAGMPIKYLINCLHSKRIIRVMPNMPAQVGLALSGLYAEDNISEADRLLAQQIMTAVGQVVCLENEEEMHAITAISGSGPAYIFYLLDALSRSAQKLGFSEDLSKQLSLATFQGAVELAKQSDLSFKQLQNNVTSKGGTTYAAISEFEQSHLDDIIHQGIDKAYQRSIELGGELINE